MWAKTYQIVYKPSVNIANFQQRSVKQIIFNPDSTVKLVLENYYKANILGASINQTPSKGDFVRFVRKRVLFNNELITTNLFKADFASVSVPYAGTYSLNLNSYISETYDPSGTMVSGVFTAPITSSYRVSCETTITVNYTGVATQANVSIIAKVNGTTEYYVAGSTTI